MKKTNDVIFISDGNIFSAPPVQELMKKLSMRDMIALQDARGNPEQAYTVLEKLLNALPEENEFKHYIYDITVDEIDYATRAMEAWMQASVLG